MCKNTKTAIDVKSAGILALLAMAVFLSPVCVAGAGKVKEPGKSLHGEAWAFGQSATRKDALWHKGLDAEAVSRRAVPPRKPHQVDTSGGIKRALNEADKKERKSIGVSVGNQSSAWKVDPNAMRADEFKPRDKQHVVRAYADVKAGDDLDINFGPELILRDERSGEEAAHEKQPDSALGVGMRFKYDF